MSRQKVTPKFPTENSSLDAIEKAAKALAQLSDAEWLQLKRVEDRRRADQRTIRELSRELRDRKRSPFFTTTENRRRTPKT